MRLTAWLVALSLALTACGGVSTEEDDDDMQRGPRGFLPMPPTPGPTSIPLTGGHSRTLFHAPALPEPETGKYEGKTSTELFDPIVNAGGFSQNLLDSPGTEYRLAQVEFPSPRNLTVYAGVLLAENIGAFSGTVPPLSRNVLMTDPAGPTTTDVWVLGRIRLGLHGTTFPIYFDMPIGDLIQIPVVAETVEVSARLINPLVYSGTIITAIQDPPGLVVPPGATFNVPFVRANAFIGQGEADSNAERYMRGTIANNGVAHDVVLIPDGVDQARVVGNPATGTTMTWGFGVATGGAITQFDQYPVNDGFWRDIPPSAFSVRITSTAAGGPNTNFAVFFRTGFSPTQ